MVDEIEVSENKEALIVLAGTVAGAATTFVASLSIPLDIKAPATELASTIYGRDSALLEEQSQQAIKQASPPFFSQLFFWLSGSSDLLFYSTLVR